MRVLAGRFAAGLVLAVALLSDADRAVASPVTGLRVEVMLRGEGRETQVSVFVAGRHIRIEQAGESRGAPRHVLIYRGDEDRFLSLDPRDRAYVEVDRALIAAATTPTRAARREVDARLDELPASHHFALERLLGLRPSAANATPRPITIRRTDVTDRVAGWACRRIELRRDGATIAELCVTDWAEIGLDARDLEVFRQLANFQRELMGARELTPLEIVPDQSFELLVQFEGFPLYLRGVAGSVLRGEIVVTSASARALDASLFEPPGDYRVRSAYELLFDEPVPAAPASADPAPGR